MQVEVISWAREHEALHPGLELLFHCPNEGRRSPRSGARMKRMGMMAGVPDLQLPLPVGRYSGLWMELKTKRGRLTDTQKWWLERLQRYGHHAVVCRSAEEAIDQIAEYTGMFR